jgi:hypothetical protein
MDFLKQQSNVDPTRIAAIGYFMGSTVALNMAGQGIEEPNLCGQSLEKISSDQEIVRTNVIFR